MTTVADGTELTRQPSTAVIRCGCVEIRHRLCGPTDARPSRVTNESLLAVSEVMVQAYGPAPGLLSGLGRVGAHRQDGRGVQCPGHIAARHLFQRSAVSECG